MDFNSNNASYYVKEADSNVFTMSLFERNIKFYLLLIMDIPSLCCTVLIFRHFKRSDLHSRIFLPLLMNNAVIIVTELPITLMYLHNGALPTESICTGWIVLNYSLFLLSITLMAWASVERYLFIYHERIIVGHYILLHHVPFLCLILYCPLFYLSTVVWYKCQSVYDEHRYVCGGACYQQELALGLIDRIGNVLCVVFFTFIVNLILIIRNATQRHRMKKSIITANRSQKWRRSMKLIIQLLSVSMLYMVGWIPYSTIALIQIFANNQLLAYLLSTYFTFIPYLQTLLLPYICLFFMPNIKHKFYDTLMLLCWRKTIRPKNQVHIMANEHGSPITELPLVN